MERLLCITLFTAGTVYKSSNSAGDKFKQSGEVFLSNGPFALTGHMVKIRRNGWKKSVASSTGTSETKESHS